MKSLQWVVVLAFTVFIALCLIEKEKVMGQSGGESQHDSMLVINTGTVRSLGLNEQDMLALVYDVNEIPGFECTPNPSSGIHTNIYLDNGGDKAKGGIESQIIRGWCLNGDWQSTSIRIECKVLPAQESAQNWLKAMLNPNLSSGSRNFRQDSFSGLPLGDACWGNPQFQTLQFTAGPVFAMVQAAGEGVDNTFVEALALYASN